MVDEAAEKSLRLLAWQELRLDWKEIFCKIEFHVKWQLRWLTLEAALDAAVLVVRTEALGWYETSALVALHAQAADHRAAVLARINDDPINHWKMTPTWEGRMGKMRDKAIIYHQRGAAFCLSRSVILSEERSSVETNKKTRSALLMACLTAIGSAFWTHNQLLLDNCIDRTAVSRQHKRDEHR